MTKPQPGPAPFLRWAGSKKKLVPVLATYWSATYRRYLEPFAGSACLFFSIPGTKAVLNDINAELIETYHEVKYRPQSLTDALGRIPLGRASYYTTRAIDPATLDRTERAARFIFLNRYCFNGLYRTNLNGQFNVPYAPARTGPLPTAEDLKRASRHLQRARLMRKDFEAIVDQATDGDFIYLDPPYAVENRRLFRQYNPNCFGIADIARLNESLHRCDARGAHFVLSYAYCREALSHFTRWRHRKLYIQRNISGFAKYRRRAAELIITNIPDQD